ncbi:MAG: type II toxin-antitoxin system RelE/ParE family toxin [Bacteroidales bacterium]|nr:type II toxin-antitoxin system RelE/ParE family toxin [Bacteroidales bacterium]
MNVVWSKKFTKSIKRFFSYCLDNYGETISTKKYQKLSSIINRLSAFPEIGFIDPFLKDENKVCRVVMFEKKYKLVYCIEKETIILVNLLDTYKNPKTLKKYL